MSSSSLDEGTAGAVRIPNIYHFVFGLRPQTEPFHLLHYLCLESCLRVSKPDRLIVHLRNEPFGRLWDLIRPHIEIMPIPEGTLDVDLSYRDDFMRGFSYAHLSDFVRLRILQEYGGVYADMDTLFLAPLPANLFDKPCVMGRELVDTNVPGAPDGSLCNAFIMAEPGSAFIAEWLKRMPGAFDGSWSNHSTFLPYRLSEERPDLVHVEPEGRFFALDWSRDGIRGLFEENRSLPPEATSLHLWAHLWWDAGRGNLLTFDHTRLTEDYVARSATTYARHAKPFLPASDPVAPRKSKAMLLTPVLPHPNGIGLARRCWQWASELSAEHDLEIVFVARNAKQRANRVLPGTLTVVPFTPASQRQPLSDWLAPDEVTAASLRSFEGPRPERIVVFRFYLHEIAALLPAEWRSVLEVDCDDWESATRLSLGRIALRNGDLREAWDRLRQAVRYAWLERRLLGNYRTVYASADIDAVRMARMTGQRTIQAKPNKIAVPVEFEPQSPPPGSRTLLFVGTLSYPPNADAVDWCLQEVLPVLRRLVPDVRVVIAGQAKKDLVERIRAAGAKYAQAPKDLSSLYQGAAGVIAPLRGGGGTKLKVLEAWLHRRALVATSHSVRGLKAEPGHHFLLADKAVEFAKACARVITDPELRTSLAINGEALVRERFSASYSRPESTADRLREEDRAEPAISVV